MTKQIEETLNLPSIQEALEQMQQEAADEELLDDEKDDELPEFDLDEIKNALAQYSNMSKDLSNINDFSDNERKLNELQEKAISAHTDLLDGGFTAPPGQTTGFFEPAISSLNIAVDVEKTKINNKLKLLQLQLEDRKLQVQERKLELAERKMNNESPNGEELGKNGDGVYTTREEILKTFKSMNKPNTDK